MARATGVEKYVNEQRVISTRPDSAELLEKIACPTLVLGGEDDLLSPPASMDAITARIPTAIHAVIKDSGHLPPLENPSATTAALRVFLNRARIQKK